MAVLEAQLSTTLDALSAVIAGQGRRWFRGQGCHHRGLLPSLYRRMQPGATATDIIDTETRLIVRFRQRSLPWWPEGYPQTDWEQLFAMQHHGVPTRLLDWTESALSALFFAADHQRARCECAPRDCLPTLWVLDPVAFNAGNPRLHGMPPEILTPRDASVSDAWKPGPSLTLFAPSPVAIYGTHNSARIAAQQGVFTIAGREVESLDESPAVVAEPAVLQKIVLQCEHDDVMRDLRSLGVTRSAVYPELMSLAQDIALDEGL